MADARNLPEDPARLARDEESGVVLKIRDLGPIARGEMSLRPLTVFAGPSNTGKSWLAILVYGLRYYLTDPRRDPDTHIHGVTRNCREEWKEKTSDARPFPERPQKWLDAVRAGEKIVLTKSETECVRILMEIVARRCISEIMRCYGVTDPFDLVRNQSEGMSSVSFRVGMVEYRLDIRAQWQDDMLGERSPAGMQWSVQAVLPEKIEVECVPRHEKKIESLLEEVSASGHESSHRSFSSFRLCRLVKEDLEGFDPSGVNENCGPIYYLPADRGGVMHTRTLVASALVQDASDMGMRPRRRPGAALSGVQTDFLTHLFNLPEGRRVPEWRRQHTNLSAKRLETEILQGDVVVERVGGDMPGFFYRPKDWNEGSLPLKSASAMVSEIVPVVLFLRYMLGRNDTLILEEPEARLHPAAQRQFAEEIAAWVKQGVRVIVTTHSEWILEELSNIVGRGEIRLNKPKAGPSLKKEDVGVWLFDFLDRNNPGLGSEIKEVHWDPDDGGYETGFYEVAVERHNAWAGMLNQAIDEERNA